MVAEGADMTFWSTLFIFLGLMAISQSLDGIANAIREKREK
jgi:hypothetical protein